MRSWLHYVFILGSLGLGSSMNCYAQKIFEQRTARWAEEVEQSYRNGIKYLVGSQNAQGYWTDDSYGSETGVVGLAVVAILAHGDDPNFGPYKDAVHKGLKYILDKANKDTGYIGTSMYNHGFATLALAEAYGVVNEPRLGPALRRAVDLIVNAQKKNPLGAWRYSPEAKDADVTVSGAQMVALLAAKNAGLHVPKAAFEKGRKFMVKCQSSNGGFGYTSPSGPNAPRSAIGCLSLALTNRFLPLRERDAAMLGLKGKGNNNAEVYYAKALDDARGFLVNQSDSVQSHYQLYSLYYTSQAIFHAIPKEWPAWNQKNIKRLKASQNNETGSWSGSYGTTFSTSAALLSLALNYRFLPIYER
ncbi:MAG: prenyltransferase/squalene oxidase repeat-containing protein [Opitutales bacterium]|jgi:hypothetical protein